MPRYAPSIRHALLSAAVAIAIVAGGPLQTTARDNTDQKWKAYPNCCPTINRYIRAWFSGSFPSTAFKDRVTDGASRWNNVGRDFKFVTTGSSSNHQMVIDYKDLLWPNGDAWAIETNVKFLGGGEIQSASISFNSTPGGSSWYTGTGTPGATQGDVTSIATHEWGHAVALKHSQYSADEMWPYINPGQIKDLLTLHDKDGIKWLYPVAP